MTHDDDMREIEAALDTYLCEGMEKPQLLALIRAKMGNAAQNAATCAQGEAEVAQNDAEHEAKVEAWRETITACRLDGLRTETGFSVYGMPYVVIDDALRLMRARPAATERDTAAGELLRAAKDVLHNFHVDMELEHRRGFYGPQDVDAMHAMSDAIEAAERAGVTP